MARRVYGVGVMDLPGEAYFPRGEVGGRTVKRPAYRAWENMLRRAYCAKLKAKRPTYAGVTVCDEWHTFSTFRRWWLENRREGWELDKDLLGDSRQYGPDSCIYIPGWLNTFTSDSGAIRGAWPIGVRLDRRRGQFMAECCHPFTEGKKGHFLGYFTCPQEAHKAWKARKLEIAAELKPRMDEIDARLYPRVVAIIERMV